jgi:hypothetical protein
LMPHKDRSGHSFLEICIYSSSFRSVPSICDPCLSTDGRCPFVSLVALLTWRDLLFCAKHLFVAAIGGRVRAMCAAIPGRRREALSVRKAGEGGSFALRDGQNAMHDAAAEALDAHRQRR